MGKVVLCADAETLRRPQLMGLEGVDLEGCPWLETFSGAEEVRAYLKGVPGAREVWVCSADDMDALNVAAALKRDRADHRVSIVGSALSGSALSRAKAAGIDEALAADAFARRYAQERLARSGAPDATVALPKAAAPALSMRVDAGPAGRAQRTMAPSAPSGHRAKVLMVAAGSGGVGKSAVSVVAAHLAAARGLRVLLLDADLQLGDCALLSGAQGAMTADGVVADLAMLERVEPPAGLPLVIGAPARMELSEVLAPQLPALLDAAMPRFDLVVANAGASWSDGHLQMMERSSAVLMMVGQRVASVRGCQRVVDLCRRCGIATGQLLYAVNRCGRGALLTSVDVSCALDGAQVVELRDGGQEVEELLGAGAAATLAASKNPFCASVGCLIDQVLGAQAPGCGTALPGSAQALGEGGREGLPSMPPRRKRGKGRGPRQRPMRRDRAAALGMEVPFGASEVRSWA